MADKVKVHKVARTESLKKLRCIAAKIDRLVEEEIPTDSPPADLLEVLDETWFTFCEDHNELAAALVLLEEQKEGAGAKEGIVGGKSMGEYSTIAKTTYTKAKESLTKKVKEDRILDQEQSKRVRIATLDREMNSAMRCLAGELQRIGYKDHPEDIQDCSAKELKTLRIKIDGAYRHLERLGDVTVNMVALDLSTLHEAIETAQAAEDEGRRHLEGIISTLRVLQDEKPTSPSEEPQVRELPGLCKASDRKSVREEQLSETGSQREEEEKAKPPFKGLKIKAMDMPKFTGKRRDWSNFISVWENIILRQGYSNYVLAQQLALAVKGTFAEDLIKAVELNSNSSYGIMMSRLKEFYEDTGSLLASLYSELDGMRSVKTGTPREIISYVNDIEGIHEKLYSLDKLFPDKVDVNKVDQLVRLLPQDLQLIWNRAFHDFDVTTKQSCFSDFVRFICKERSIRLRFLEVSPEIKGHQKKASATNSYAADADKPQQQKGYCWLDDSHKGHFANQCSIWRGMSPSDRRRVTLEKKRCIVCLNQYGREHKCRQIPQYALEKYHCKTCKIKHRKDIACTTKEDSKDVSSGSISSGTAYIARYEVKVKDIPGKIAIFCDNGSDISFIYDKVAKERGYKLVGNKFLNVTTINGTERVRSQIYSVPVITINGSRENIKCYSIGHPVTRRSTGVNLKKIAKLFPKYKTLSRLDRSEEPCEILLGLDYHHLHSNKTLYSNGGLSIRRGALGDTLIGCIKGDKSDECSTGSYYITKAQDLTWNKFIQGEDLGMSVYPQCGGCRCDNCPPEGHQHSFKDEEELELIKSGLRFENGHWVCKCPWIKSPDTLPDNKYVAEATLKSTIRTLKRDPKWYEAYSLQIRELLIKGFCKRLSKAEEIQWKGLVYYICHLAVLAPKSASTPIRIVFNSSQTCKGISLNSIQAKGPKIMNSLMEILIRWREYPGVVLGDISKMFYAIKLEETDQHLHRFIYQGPDDKEPVTYVMTALSMGDVCSPCVAMQALYQTGERVETEHPEVGYVLKKSSYVDDLAHSTLADPIEVARKVDRALGDHGFKVKEWLFRGEAMPRKTLQDEQPPEPENKKMLKGKDGQTSVLGINWNSLEDKIQYKAEINFSKKIRGFRSEDDMKKESFNDKFPETLTKRMVLEQVGRIFDPLGLVGPHALRAKILLRQTWDMTEGWDSEMPTELYTKWKSWFASSFQLNDISFTRCTRPDNPMNEEPELIIFSDGSKEASGITCYARWKIGNEEYESRLILGKNRIAPREVVSIPRMELNGAVIGVRAREVLTKACRYKFSAIYHLVDSETVLNQVNSVSRAFEVYEANRISEIRRICKGDMSLWYWLPGVKNIADANTRGKTPNELGPESEWQKGPEFMKKPFNEWPVKSVAQIRVTTKETMEISVLSAAIEAKKPDSIVCFQRVSKFETLVKAIGRVLMCIQSKPLPGKKPGTSRPTFNRMKQGEMTVEIIQKAELLILKEAQMELHQPAQKYRKLGVVKTKENLWAVGARNAKTDNDLQVLIPYKHRLALLLMNKSHREARHTGRDSTLQMFRLTYYMAHASRMAKMVRERCSLCRLKDKRTLTQKMGKVPLVSLKPAPVFNYTQLDLLGPFKVRGEVNKRSTGKAWICLFVCMASKAIHLEIICGYATDNFLLGLQNFCNLRGWPEKIYSDPGSQLVGAARELKDAWAEMNTDEIKGACLAHKTEWKFSPGDSPHYQGVSESLIRTVKRAVEAIYGHGTRLSYPEYVTLGHNVANMVNSRPLSLVPSEPGDEMAVLTPNSLILGRNKSENPRCYPKGNSIPRTSEVNEIITRFWKKWMEIARPALMQQKKWHEKTRNLVVDDVVIVLENDALGKAYRLARVVKTIPSEDGLVRKVKVSYMQYKKTEQGTSRYTGGSSVEITRSVQRLVLIVPREEPTTL